MTTKESIETEALNLLCIKGYSGVSIRDIARAVGIKESSIYKHYKSKEDIFETIVAHYVEKTESIFAPPSGDPGAFTDLSKEMLIGMMKATFQTFAMDEYISKCRKLFMISAPGDAKIGSLYTGSFISEPIRLNTVIFQKLLAVSKAGMKAEEGELLETAAAMAYQFYSPVFLILQEYDYGMVTMEEALRKVEGITEQFMEVYGL
jgi:AcrR family transcriptional regulator